MYITHSSSLLPVEILCTRLSAAAVNFRDSQVTEVRLRKVGRVEEDFLYSVLHIFRDVGSSRSRPALRAGADLRDS